MSICFAGEIDGLETTGWHRRYAADEAEWQRARDGLSDPTHPPTHETVLARTHASLHASRGGRGASRSSPPARTMPASPSARPAGGQIAGSRSQRRYRRWHQRSTGAGRVGHLQPRTRGTAATSNVELVDHPKFAKQPMSRAVRAPRRKAGARKASPQRRQDHVETAQARERIRHGSIGVSDGAAGSPSKTPCGLLHHAFGQAAGQRQLQDTSFLPVRTG